MKNKFKHNNVWTTKASLLFIALSSLSLQTMKDNTSSYELVWSEEFNDSDSLDSNIWNFEKGYVRNNEKQYYTENRSENCRIEEGILILEARKENYKGYNYSSASITTKGKKEFLYGRIEVKAKLPTGRGVWPAIWMLGTNIDDVGWPMCGEIDIMENVGYDPSKVHGNVHTKSYNHTLGTNKGDFIESETLSEEYHVYTIDWTPENIDFYLDGEKYFSFKNDKSGDSKTWPFNRPQYLLINLAVGGFWGGKEGIDDDIFPQKYKIDYVRYYNILN